MALSEEQKRKLAEKMNKNNIQVKKPVENQPVFKPDDNNIWFMKDGDDIEGPFTDSDMLDFIDSRIIKKLTKIQKNDEGWQYAFKSELSGFFMTDGGRNMSVSNNYGSFDSYVSSENAVPDGLSIWRLVSGIISLFLCPVILSFGAWLVRQMFDYRYRYSSLQFWGGWIFEVSFIFLFVASNISIISWKSKQKKSYIATDIFYLLCLASSIFKFSCLDLQLNTISVFTICVGVWELVCMVLSELTRIKINTIGYTRKHTNGLAIASLVCALSGSPILGIIYGGIGMKKCGDKPDRYSGKGLAIAGLVIGIIGSVFTLVLVGSGIIAGIGWSMIDSYTKSDNKTIDDLAPGSAEVDSHTNNADGDAFGVGGRGDAVDDYFDSHNKTVDNMAQGHAETNRRTNDASGDAFGAGGRGDSDADAFGDAFS